MTDVDPIEVALRVAAAFEDLGIGYFLGGSLASSFQGEPRSTNDIDFVADLRPGDAARLARVLGSEFEVDEESLEDAIRRRSSWNLFFLPTVVKIDIFIKGSSPFDQIEFDRRRMLRTGHDGRSLIIKSPEDSILRKLVWYRSGGEVSSHQWRDLVQVLRTSAPVLDRDYLSQWSGQLGVADLLARAIEESEG